MVASTAAGHHHLQLDMESVDPTNGSQDVSSRKVRRNRTVFTELQLMGLETRFDSQKYLSTPDRSVSLSVYCFCPMSLSIVVVVVVIEGLNWRALWV